MMFTLFNVQKFCFVLVGLYFTLLASARPQFSGASLAKRDAIANSSALLTNAARMQAGLAPLKPRSFYRPTHVAPRHPSSSTLPSSGKIQVKKASNGNSVGYISNQIGTFGYGVTSSSSHAMHVSFTAVAPFNIAITNGPRPDLGFSGGKLTSSFGSTAQLTSTNPTAPGSTPQNVGNSLGGASESAIWFYNTNTHQLTAHWVNPDGSVLTPHIWYYPVLDTIALVLNPASQVSGYEVKLYLA